MAGNPPDRGQLGGGSGRGCDPSARVERGRGIAAPWQRAAASEAPIGRLPEDPPQRVSVASAANRRRARGSPLPWRPAAPRPVLASHGGGGRRAGEFPGSAGGCRQRVAHGGYRFPAGGAAGTGGRRPALAAGGGRGSWRPGGGAAGSGLAAAAARRGAAGGRGAAAGRGVERSKG